jgi:hypothetical protein
MFYGTSPPQLSEIDELTRSDHTYLTEDDECFFFGEYTARGGFSVGETNDFIHNFKKGMERKARPREWRYKTHAITLASGALSKRLAANFLKRATLVPMPPSKGKDDPLYDDRLVQMLQGISAGHPVDVRELLLQNGSRAQGAHGGARPGPDGLEAIYYINPDCAAPAPTLVGLFDDLLVTGASFRAGKAVIQARYPGVKVYGIFLARRAIPAEFEPVE